MITRALLQFIQREQSAGATRESLAVKLRERGWKDGDVDTAFLALADMDDHEVPAPQVGLVAEFTEILFLMWRVYCPRWKRVLGVGLVYIATSFFLFLSVVMLAFPSISTFLGLVKLGENLSAFFLMAPYFFLGMCIYLFVQLWYISTLYALALKKGDSLFERLEEGLFCLPGILGIKTIVALLLVILLIPLFLVIFLVQNLFILVVFMTLFALYAVALVFFLSLALPAYFYGMKWSEALLQSIKIVRKNVFLLATFYVFFGILFLLASFLVRHTGPIAIFATISFITPMEIIFMLAIYRYFTANEQSSKTLPLQEILQTKETKKKPKKVAKVPSA